MAKKANTWDDEWSMSESYSHFQHDHSSHGGWTTGFVATKYGFVHTYSQEDHTDLRFIWDGRMYSRTWEAEYSRQFTVTLAKRYVREITGFEKVG